MYSLHLSTEQLEFRDMIREFVAQEVKPAAIKSERLEPFEQPLITAQLDQAADGAVKGSFAGDLGIANLAMALDPSFVVIGGGLMDPENTTEIFRERYLRILREAAEPYLWSSQRGRINIVPASLGDLSQAIGAALVALYQSRS